MDRKNIAAWTEKTYPQRGYVQYLSVNRCGYYDCNVEITVRQGDEKQAIIIMSKEEFALFLLQAMREL